MTLVLNQNFKLIDAYSHDVEKHYGEFQWNEAEFSSLFSAKVDVDDKFSKKKSERAEEPPQNRVWFNGSHTPKGKKKDCLHNLFRLVRNALAHGGFEMTEQTVTLKGHKHEAPYTQLLDIHLSIEDFIRLQSYLLKVSQQ